MGKLDTNNKYDPACFCGGFRPQTEAHRKESFREIAAGLARTYSKIETNRNG